MPDATDQRPPVAVGHVRLNVVDVGAAARWLETVGLRPIVTMNEPAVLELRGGTHIVVRRAEQPPERGAGAPFDLMVDDIDAAHRHYVEKGLSPRRYAGAASMTRSTSPVLTVGRSRSTLHTPAAGLSKGRPFRG
jgi:hypothetical protein